MLVISTTSVCTVYVNVSVRQGEAESSLAVRGVGLQGYRRRGRKRDAGWSRPSDRRETIKAHDRLLAVASTGRYVNEGVDVYVIR